MWIFHSSRYFQFKLNSNIVSFSRLLMLTLVLTEIAGAEKVAILSFSLGNFHHINDSVPRDSWPISGQSSVFYPLKTSANLWSFTTVYCWFGHIYSRNSQWKTYFFVQCIHLFISHCSWDELHKNPFDVPKKILVFTSTEIGTFFGCKAIR